MTSIRPDLFRLALTAAACAAAFGIAKPAAAAPAAGSDLMNLSLEQLLDIEVTSVSKQVQRLGDAAAAISVLTREDIRRSGATTLPDLLRLVPGVQVARVDANRTAVSARGFNNVFADRLLVLIDGRTVYQPLFSGVFWDVQDTVLEDIERIEVIRGPGAWLWGTNAVNGVINITTRRAADTQGTLVSAAHGNVEAALTELRYGGRAGDDMHYRVYAKAFDRRGSFDPQTGRTTDLDAWRGARAGVRADASLATDKRLTVQAELHTADSGALPTLAVPTPPLVVPIDPSMKAGGGFVLGRYSQSLGGDAGEVTAQLYFDRTVRTAEGANASWTLNTVDFDIQHALQPTAAQRVVWGLGARRYDDSFEGGLLADFGARDRSYDLINIFAQDEIALTERLKLTAGGKFERNDFTGWETQPTLRLAWTPSPEHLLWAAASRAVRTPSRADLYARYNFPTNREVFGLPVFSSTMQNQATLSQTVLAYEAGYRARPTSALTFDVSVFSNHYDRLRSLETTSPAACVPVLAPPTPYVQCMAEFANNAAGDAYGVETVVDWRPLRSWRLMASATLMRVKLTDNTSTNLFGPDGNPAADGDPRLQGFLRSSFDLSAHVELDVILRYTGELKALGVPAYAALDTRLGWRLRRDLELSLVVQNATDPHHPEFAGSTLFSTTEVRRSVYGMVRATF